MAEIDVTINSRPYRIACQDGQERHVAQLGRYLDRRVHELIGSVGQVGDARLLVMASLLVADELAEAYERLQGGAPAGAGPTASETSEALTRLAQRIEGIAGTLEAT